LLWFLTDDAYISFRYVSNSLLGRGSVWNPPPFRPVEGHSNLLWMLLLEAVWRVVGVAPPQQRATRSRLLGSTP
jgi:arabinofuranosyltransferase